jgi:hypothetical protein
MEGAAIADEREGCLIAVGEAAKLNCNADVTYMI